VIDWGSFVLVAIASLVGALLLVGFAALGIRLLDSSHRSARGGAYASFAVCLAAVAFGVYLVVPIFH
jgi:hypothetical protein